MAFAAQSGTPAVSNCSFPSGQQRSTKFGRGRPTFLPQKQLSGSSKTIQSAGTVHWQPSAH